MVCRLENPEHIGLPLKTEETDCKYFPVSNSAQEVRDKLLKACTQKKVQFRSECLKRPIA